MLRSISKMFSIAKKLVNAYIVSGIEPFKFGAITEINFIVPMIQSLLTNPNYPESNHFNSILTNFMQEITGILRNLYSDADEVMLVSNSASHIFNIIAESNYQIIFSNGSMLADFVKQSLATHMFYEESKQPLTYKQLDLQKFPSEILDLHDAVKHFKSIIRLNSAVPP